MPEPDANHQAARDAVLDRIVEIVRSGSSADVRELAEAYRALEEGQAWRQHGAQPH
jgi:hypothetical protein